MKNYDESLVLNVKRSDIPVLYVPQTKDFYIVKHTDVFVTLETIISIGEVLTTKNRIYSEDKFWIYYFKAQDKSVLYAVSRKRR
jgi:hypothetical protein